LRRESFGTVLTRAVYRSAERTTASGILSLRRSLMPPWMEILLNVIGYAGFIGIAKYHKPSDKTETETDR
jgi:hypothetical protein